MSSINFYIVLIPLLAISCSGIEKSEYESVRRKNSQKEQIYRKNDTYLYPIAIPAAKSKERYPWEESSCSRLSQDKSSK